MEEANRFSRFVPERLVEAREARGYTLTELAGVAGVSHQAISKYENKKSVPGYDILEKIAETLKVPVTYFYKPIISNETGVTFFRSAALATSKSKKIHLHKISWIKEIYKYLEKFFIFPEINVPRLIDRETYIPTPFVTIDQMASEVRRSWNLGNGPISNMTLLLEKAGIVVARSPFENYKIDACSKWGTGERPVILLSDDKTAARSRFDIAHELGHLVLHSKIKQSEFNLKANYKLIESEANRFASAFLLPSSSFGSEIISNSLEHLVALKRRWKVSIQALAYRAHSIGYFEEHQHIYLRRKLAKNNQLTREPLDDVLEFEEPILLQQAIKALVEHNVKTKADITSELSLPREEIEVLAGLEPGYLSSESAKIIPLVFK
ncbi:helix-turn-helix domain-containing protein [Saccharibacillus brassicae]|uniref:ImmA/IrrE family metallo-endopeptidase n=1 Tax=Saccharibacillus brassicae TaxID=2583377 RepID=A0A4Y6UT99_SACBS|nr:XRE family transcriptional regulator [Saccharibacillus brassicae]QDH19557.1 ImmA/IrrE family metallo-endopeptidase [Saccharibacillus brassicae]